ncbi:Scr1 family TA system antitoxin-like transcriptional regulator [Streptomyces sp. NPDC004647]|uniref:Scr1 family TA system antitoxin-like transcriptional regulator n=1 Tax=Streptomyces sp. NPDC004647 TaxID=3154671 RepID=UPI0033B0A0EA
MYRIVGSRAAMRVQLEHLLELAARPRADVQVLPYDRVEPAALGGSLTLLTLPGGQMAYSEGIRSGRLIEEPDDECHQVRGRLRPPASQRTLTGRNGKVDPRGTG